MDRTTSMYHDADVLVFNTGHWWTHEKTSRGEDYYQEGNHVYPRLLCHSFQGISIFLLSGLPESRGICLHSTSPIPCSGGIG
nr:protein trichome birefringence-like 2 [Tanacetum cinerariifolium]